MDESILISVKQMLGLHAEDETFDPELMMHINSVFTTLYQLGVGPEEGYRITSKDNKWSECIPQEEHYDLMKSYIYMKVRYLFDPPTIGSLNDALKKQIDEAEWRLNINYENSIIEN